jgi:hypothetical protein
MPDKTKIIVGLVIFLVLAAFPVWDRLFAAGRAAAPELEMPDAIHGTRCVESREFMLANHMGLLNEWRDAVVRHGEIEYESVTYPGTMHTMSLTGECLRCHTSRDNFCTRCHDYADVDPKCWDCHVESRGN